MEVACYMQISFNDNTSGERKCEKNSWNSGPFRPGDLEDTPYCGRPLNSINEFLRERVMANPRVPEFFV